MNRWEKRSNSFLTIEYEQIHTEEMKRLENYYIVAIRVMIQIRIINFFLQLVGKSLMKSIILTSRQIIYKLQK